MAGSGLLDAVTAFVTWMVAAHRSVCIGIPMVTGRRFGHVDRRDRTIDTRIRGLGVIPARSTSLRTRHRCALESPRTGSPRARMNMPTLRTRFAHLQARALRGMTLLEIMIVLAILALVMGVLVGPKILDYFRRARIETTVMKLSRYANEAYPGWAMAHPGKSCPDTLADLGEYANDRDGTDAWGNPIRLLCGASLPAGARQIAFLSIGEDGREDTGDDLKSWEAPPHQ
jgi:prepilin-type N-terminal cleavage/methylation domain-containing protein